MIVVYPYCGHDLYLSSDNMPEIIKKRKFRNYYSERIPFLIIDFFRSLIFWILLFVFIMILFMDVDEFKAILESLSNVPFINSIILFITKIAEYVKAFCVSIISFFANIGK